MFVKIRNQYFNLNNIVRIYPNCETGDTIMTFSDKTSVTVHDQEQKLLHFINEQGVLTIENERKT